MNKINHIAVFAAGLFSICVGVVADVVSYELTVEKGMQTMADKPVMVLTLNGKIPGPVLRFKVGDTARIEVHNRLDTENTSIHWHGLLLPNEQDGVPYLTTPPIRPGTTHTFDFPLIHAGTYWYHSHTGLQEQRGVYGAIVVEPVDGEPVHADRDYVLQLSDWVDQNPREVMRSLRRGSEYPALKKGVMQSMWGAHKSGKLGDYLARERSRMPPMDISDVAYDAFLINGMKTSHLDGRPGERLRLRLINSGASTYFYVHMGGGDMTVVAADGVAVEPFSVTRLLIGMAETYDVIITLPDKGSVEVRATAQDGNGFATTYIGNGPALLAEDIPPPDIYDMDMLMMQALDEGDLTRKESKKPMAMPSPRPLSPYRQLRALAPTSLPEKNPHREITLRLTGNMERYIWSFNGKMLNEESMIKVARGENLRIEMINDTMMHHPIHLHGHFFRLINGQGAHAPLKHTVDVPPMSRRIIEFEANEEKDWFIHCHMLYHMMAGMARVVSYTEQGPDHKPNLGPHAQNEWFNWGMVSFQSHMSEGLVTWSSPYDDILVGWEIGWQEVDQTEHETDVSWEHYFNPNWKSFVGGRFTNEDGLANRGIIGVRYRLPGLVMSEWGVDTEGDVRVGLDKEFQLTSRVSAFGEIQYDIGSQWEVATGLTYTLNRPVSLIAQYHSEYGVGGGAVVRF